MSTSLVPRPAPRARTIVSALALLVLGSLATAQRRPAAAAGTESATKPAPESARLAQATQAAWQRITSALTAEYYARHPDVAFRSAWPKALELDLGAIGDGSGLRWRNALSSARGELARLAVAEAPPNVRAQVSVLADWVEAELLLLDAQALPLCDPASHVRQATRTLRAVVEAEWIPMEERHQELSLLLAELPAYLGEAQLSLLSPCAPWLALALCDLDDLEQLAETLAGMVAPPAPEPAARPNRRERAKPARDEDEGEAAAALAIEQFRGWLLAFRSNASLRPPALDAAEWSRLVELTLGTAWEPGEIKALCLRDLALLELAEPRKPSGRGSTADKRGAGKAAPDAQKPRATRSAGKRTALRVKLASTRALQIAQTAHVLRQRPAQTRLEFGAEESPCAGLEVVSLRDGSACVLRALLQLPHRSWTAGRTAARENELGNLQLLALGVRYGLAGEALFRQAQRADQSLLAGLPVERAQSAAFGLFAQDWIGRVDWVENPLAKNVRLRRELERQRGREAARLLAALELHAEGISVDEAAAGFRRRTGVHEDVALAEALCAERDPLYGIGYLGLLELRALEQRLAAVSSPRRGLATALLLVLRHPGLRACDLARDPASALELER